MFKIVLVFLIIIIIIIIITTTTFILGISIHIATQALQTNNNISCIKFILSLLVIGFNAIQKHCHSFP